MTSPSMELQGEIVRILKGDPAVTAIVAQRIFDNVPRNDTGTITADYPLVAMGPKQTVADDAECIVGFEITMQVDCWSRKPSAEIEKLADAVRRALAGVTGNSPPFVNALVLFEFQDQSIRREDGLTSHAILTFRALVEQR